MSNLKIITQLESERLFIRKYVDDDAEKILNLIFQNRERLKDSKVITKDVYEMQSLNDALNYIKKMHAGWIFKKLFAFGLFEKENNSLIGEYKVFNVDWESKQAESGGFLGYKSEGKMYFNEVSGFIDVFVFEHLQMDKMIVSCLKNNLVSIFNIERSKMFKKINETNDAYYYSTNKDNYFTNR